MANGLSRYSFRRWNHLHLKRRGRHDGMSKCLLHDGRSIVFRRRSNRLRKIHPVLMARCAERPMTEPTPITGPNIKHGRVETTRPFLLPDHTVEQKVFNCGRRNGPIGRDSKVKKNHPTIVCRKLIPQVHTLSSFPPPPRGQMGWFYN